MINNKQTISSFFICVFSHLTPATLTVAWRRSQSSSTQVCRKKFFSFFAPWIWFPLCCIYGEKRSQPVYWMILCLVWLLAGRTFHWCLVTMKISSLDTEVTATAPHQVAIWALCVLHHCKKSDWPNLWTLGAPLQPAAFIFWGLAGRHGFPSYSDRITQDVFPLFSQKLVSANHFDSSASLYISDVSINLALASLICWRRRHIGAALTVSTEVRQDREL